MNSCKSVFLLGSLSFIYTQVVLADLILEAPTVISESKTVNRGYAGLQWTLGQGLTPNVVLGLRRAIVHSDGETQGGDISFSFNLIGGLHPEKLRVKFFNGRENIQGEVGGGYDFTKGFYGGLGIQGPYSNLGVDYLFTKGRTWEAYFILNTLKAYNKPAATLLCEPYEVLNAGICEIWHAHLNPDPLGPQ